MILITDSNFQCQFLTQASENLKSLPIIQCKASNILEVILRASNQEIIFKSRNYPNMSGIGF